MRCNAAGEEGDAVPGIRSLDDQTYGEIVEQAKSRLPWLCPDWTNHNASDPGITILELMAWYKELQQYYMDQTTPGIRRSLLKLAGITPEGPAAASCVVEAETGGKARLAGERLESPQGIPFELSEPIPAVRTCLASMRIVCGGVSHDVGTLAAGDASFRPFAFATAREGGASGQGGLFGQYGAAGQNGTSGQNGTFGQYGASGQNGTPGQNGAAGGGTDSGTAEGSVLRLGFSGRPGRELRLWFDVDEPEGSRRNPADGDSVPPRTIVWEIEARGTEEPDGVRSVAVEPVRDETWALSWSGYVTLPVPESWVPGEDGLYWLTVRQTDGGCEEEVRMNGVSANRFRCEQRESVVRRYGFRVAAAENQEVLIPNAQAQFAEVAVFLRTAEGWEQTDRVRGAVTAGGRRLLLDASGCVQDGEDNVSVVCQDGLDSLLFDTTGVPEERLHLNLDLDGKQVLELELICQTLEADGTVRPALWTRTEDLSVLGPRDCAFLWDGQREEIVFGDGLHGALPEPGTGSVMVSSLTLSRCAGGNIPAGAGLMFQEDGTWVENGAASGGRDAETLEEARGRLLRKLADTDKCQSAADFQRCAMRTPGLRLAGAKALPGYDAAMGPERRHAAYVSVVLLPASEAARPLPDARFLAAADRQLARFRPVCVQTKAIPPRYIPVAVTAEVLVQPGTEREEMEADLRAWLRPRAELAGSTVRRSDAAAVLQRTALHVRRVEIRLLGSGGYVTAAGDLRLPPDGLPSLEAVELELMQT